MMLNSENITRKHVERYLEASQLELTEIIEVGNMDLLIEFAKIGVGVACVIKGFVKEELSDGSLMEIPLSEPFPKREVGFAYKESGKSSKSLQSFLQFINRYQVQNQGNNKEVTQ